VQTESLKQARLFLLAVALSTKVAELSLGKKYQADSSVSN
jgi:hypothetical protein